MLTQTEVEIMREECRIITATCEGGICVTFELWVENYSPTTFVPFGRVIIKGKFIYESVIEGFKKEHDDYMRDKINFFLHCINVKKNIAPAELERLRKVLHKEKKL